MRTFQFFADSSAAFSYWGATIGFLCIPVFILLGVLTLKLTDKASRAEPKTEIGKAIQQAGLALLGLAGKEMDAHRQKLLLVIQKMDRVESWSNAEKLQGAIAEYKAWVSQRYPNVRVSQDEARRLIQNAHNAARMAELAQEKGGQA